MSAEDLLIKEYFWLQSTIEDFGSQPITIKGWSATVAFAALLALYAKGSIGKVGVWLAAFAALPFWITDALWKTYQRAYQEQAEMIEALVSELNGVEAAAAQFKTLQISRNWQAFYGDSPWEKLANFCLAFIEPSVLFPHAPIILLGIVLAIFLPPKTS